MKDASIVICTHNPRTAYLERTIAAVQAQNFPRERWELIVIDNGSSKPVSLEPGDTRNGPPPIIIREELVGLTHARLRGIKESSGSLVVFVDDDNLLSPDYLTRAVKLAEAFPAIGAFGGSIRAEFEIPPPGHLLPYIETLAVCELHCDYFSNDYQWSKGTPYGAGMVVRRQVANHYAIKAQQNHLRLKLDRAGKNLSSGGDTDLAWCALDLGLGNARFMQLQSVHLIPKERLTDDYIVRLHVGSAAAADIFPLLRPHAAVVKRSLRSKLYSWLRLVSSPPMERKIALARFRRLGRLTHD